ncbi:hypothetical protein [Salininema proteolyticum]|uniref:Ferric iron reductase FhuF-like transporter n=1 Tax=Salininema proteolyticum TaxID=1607685 RepID=A0ABV8TXI2_9ACTN
MKPASSATVTRPIGDRFPVPVICPAGGETIAPLQAAARHVSELHGDRLLRGIEYWLRPDREPAGIDWAGAEDLLADEALLDLLLSSLDRTRGGAPHVSASLAWKTYSYWVIAPVVFGYLTARRVPAMGLADFSYSVDADRDPLFLARQKTDRFLVLGHDPARANPGTTVVADEAEMLRTIRATVYEGHLSLVMDRITERVRLSRRLMRGSIASAIAYTAAAFADLGVEPPEVAAKTLLELFDVPDLVEIRTDELGRLQYERKTCCLALNAERPAVCGTCPVSGRC